MLEKGRVCVTGGGGFQASWLVKLLLSKGYIVHATVRNPDEEKNAHLKTLDKALENLRLFKADLLDYNSLFTAIRGCSGVFHVATAVLSDHSVANPEIDIIEAAVTGTSNVLRACSMANVERVVVVSSIAAVEHNSKWPRGQPMDESCWSDKECRTAEPGYKWYTIAKTVAEGQALMYGKTSGLDVVTVCPSAILGPLLQSTVNSSSLFFPWIMKGGSDTIENKPRMVVDVRDMAEALLLAYEKPEAEGRYICSSHTIYQKDFVEKIKAMYPMYNYPKRFSEIDEDWDISSEKLQKLGWRYRPLEETIADSVTSLKKRGILK